MVRKLIAPGPAIVVALVAALSGCGGGDSSLAQDPSPTLVPILGQTASADPSASSSAVTPSPTVKATPKATPKASAKASPKATAKPTPRPTEAAAPETGDVVALTIKNFAFMPKDLTMKVGQTLVVTNLDSAVHTITSDDGSFDSGDLNKGETFRFTFTKAGTFSYFCDLHQYMTGTITVS